MLVVEEVMHTPTRAHTPRILSKATYNTHYTMVLNIIYYGTQRI